MNYLVGLTAERGGRDALALGRMLARTGDVTLTVCIVLPEVWGHPSLARVRGVRCIPHQARRGAERERC